MILKMIEENVRNANCVWKANIPKMSKDLVRDLSTSRMCGCTLIHSVS